MGRGRSENREKEEKTEGSDKNGNERCTLRGKISAVLQLVGDELYAGDSDERTRNRVAGDLRLTIEILLVRVENDELGGAFVEHVAICRDECRLVIPIERVDNDFLRRHARLATQLRAIHTLDLAVRYC